MEDWGEFVWTVIASSAGTTALLLSLAFLLKTQISHWLVKDLEVIKAKHQRDLEAYKISLIAEAERAKAFQSVKTAAALRSIERKFAILEALHLALHSHLPEIIDAVTGEHYDTSGRIGAIQKCQLRVRKLKDSIDEAAPFVSFEELSTLSIFHGVANDLILKSVSAGLDKPLKIDADLEASIFTESAKAIMVARNHISNMTLMV